MKQKQRLEKEIAHFKQTIKYLRKGYGRKVCNDIIPSCPNCMAQFCIGWIIEHLCMLEDNFKEEFNVKKK